MTKSKFINLIFALVELICFFQIGLAAAAGNIAAVFAGIFFFLIVKYYDRKFNMIIDIEKMEELDKTAEEIKKEIRKHKDCHHCQFYDDNTSKCKLSGRPMFSNSHCSQWKSVYEEKEEQQNEK